MKLLQLTPGAGENFYCENCLRAALLRALRRHDGEAYGVPLYLPPLDEKTGRSQRGGKVFFGGVNVYLQQKWGFFRHSPRWLDRLFDAGWLLRWAGRKTGMTDAHVLGETTVSMLRGEHGRQNKELDRLAGHLHELAPEVLIFSNALLIGLARRLREVTGAAAVCWLTDEEMFLDDLPEPYREEAWGELRRRCGDVDRFLSPSEYYAARMRGRLGLSEDNLDVLPQGVEINDGASANPGDSGNLTVGFLGQFSRDSGLDLLVEAAARLREQPHLAGLRIRAVGGCTDADKPFVRELTRRIEKLSLGRHIELCKQFDETAKQNLFVDAVLLAAPARRATAWSRSVLEAQAAGLPVVAADHGGAAEILRRTNGGVLCEPGSADALAEAIRGLLENRERASEMGKTGRRAVAEHYNLDNTARGLLRVARQLREEAT
jgi:glycosyltransferase involved in cell wall biosynthesis